ncbi:MAG: UTP--glucose-1-phosphate uridylyltransferase [Bacteriovoracaceae bacterium]|jgi:UTP--glucose-1-phosphate uridylyltransferase|nr:UTP--glucose-1-phosphate uridylyltransferase [Bacteriovoracaceae bacterium]
MKIRKAVIPVAGKGTRFLPASKEIPKEMIPIINKPMIHYAVMEAIEAGIEEILFITSEGKGSIEHYFKRNNKLEKFLKERGKDDLFEQIKTIGSSIEIQTIRQDEQLGLGHAISYAEEFTTGETFCVILGDDLILAETPVCAQLMSISNQYNNNAVIGVMEVANQDTDKYGIVDGIFLEGKKTLKMKKMVEKPSPDKAPTNLATPGRYILTNKIFDCLREIPRGVGGEYQLTDAINLLAERQDVYAHIFIGDRFDTGSIKGYLNATVEFALRNSETRDMMEEIIKDKVERYKL